MGISIPTYDPVRAKTVSFIVQLWKRRPRIHHLSNIVPYFIFYFIFFFMSNDQFTSVSSWNNKHFTESSLFIHQFGKRNMYTYITNT